MKKTEERENEFRIYLASLYANDKKVTIEKDTVCSPIELKLADNIRKYAEENDTNIATIIRELLMVFALDHGLLPTQNKKTNGKYIPEKAKELITAQRILNR